MKKRIVGVLLGLSVVLMYTMPVFAAESVDSEEAFYLGDEELIECELDEYDFVEMEADEEDLIECEMDEEELIEWDFSYEEPDKDLIEDDTASYDLELESYELPEEYWDNEELYDDGFVDDPESDDTEDSELDDDIEDSEDMYVDEELEGDELEIDFEDVLVSTGETDFSEYEQLHIYPEDDDEYISDDMNVLLAYDAYCAMMAAFETNDLDLINDSVALFEAALEQLTEEQKYELQIMAVDYEWEYVEVMDGMKTMAGGSSKGVEVNVSEDTDGDELENVEENNGSFNEDSHISNVGGADQSNVTVNVEMNAGNESNIIAKAPVQTADNSHVEITLISLLMSLLVMILGVKRRFQKNCN